MTRSVRLTHVVLEALAFFWMARSARAQECADARFSTLPNAEEGLYPPDRFVLHLSSATCDHAPPLDVTLDSQEIEGTQEVFVAGQDAWLIWRPLEALEASRRYEIHGGDVGETLAFTLPAFIRKADAERDGRAADPFSNLEWRSADREVEVDRACCSTGDYEDYSRAFCHERSAMRPIIEASGTAPPWFVYWLESDNAALAATTSSGPFFELDTPWTVSAALREPSDSLCARVSARSLLTDELHTMEHCAQVPESTVFEHGVWDLAWVDGCFSPPGAKCDRLGQRCRSQPQVLRDAWCGASLEECFETHGNEMDCGAHVCAAAWGSADVEGGAEPNDEDPPPSTPQSASSSGCSACPGSSGALWPGLAMLGALLGRAWRARRPTWRSVDQRSA